MSRAVVVIPLVCLFLMACTKEDKTQKAQPVEVEQASQPLKEGRTKRGGATGQKNVVLIILDTLRADMMSTYGHRLDTSPELTQLAQAGVKFDRAIASSSWTRPSIATIVTGHYPRTLGIYRQRDQILNDRFFTLAEMLQGKGYRTYGRTANPNINRVFNFHQGFDAYVDSVVVYGWMKPDNPGLNQSKNQLASAKDIYQSALDWVDQQEEAEAGGPYYLQLDVMEMHEYYRGANALTRKEFHSLFPKARYKKYLQALRQLSKDTGTFVDALTKRPGWENTLFVFVSDHGEGLGDHPDVPGSRYHGTVVYESNVRVPFMLYDPSWTPSQHTVTTPVRLLDLVPTVLDYVGISPSEPLPGKSLIPLTEGKTIELPEYFITESFFVGKNKIGAYGGDWKYIQNRDRQKGVNPKALQKKGGRENGIKTDQIGAKPKVAQPYADFLKSWEKVNPKTPHTPYKKAGLSEDELEQLKAIGYVE